MEKQTLTMEQIDNMISVLSENHGIMREKLEVMYMMPPEKYVENIADFSNDYLVELICCLWEYFTVLDKFIDWKRFDSVQWGKLTARFGNKLNGKSDVIPYWGHTEWAYVFSRIPENQLEQACLDCDKWDEFTAEEWAEVANRNSDFIEDKLCEALKHFTLQEWYDFLISCDYGHHYIEDCPFYDQLIKEHPDLLN